MVFQILFVAGLALVHLFAGKLRYDPSPRSGWLSFAGGVSVAYVFVHIFPELQEAQETLSSQGFLGFLEHHAYLLALVGLAAFYGLERLAKQHGQATYSRQDDSMEATAGKSVFWVHIGAFALYNALIGYLLVYREDSSFELLFFFLAMAFHLFVNDHGLFQHHRHEYLGKGRWILSAAVVIGWGTGLAVEISDAATSLLFAFLAGALVLNVLKEELPEERQSRFLPFANGAVICTGLLLMV